MYTCYKALLNKLVTDEMIFLFLILYKYILATKRVYRLFPSGPCSSANRVVFYFVQNIFVDNAKLLHLYPVSTLQTCAL